MSQSSTQQVLDQLNWRYAVKKFDPTRKIDPETWYALEQSLILTPSSYGLQPWKFIVITDAAIKDQLPALSWNQTQPRDCSHMVAFAAKRTIDEDHIAQHMTNVVATRNLPPGAMDAYKKILNENVGKMSSHLEWNTRQVYIALGQFMTAAAMLGVDTCPMEGIHPAGYDRILELENSEFTTVVACAAGYRHPDDSQASAAKVRFAADEVVIHLS